MDRHFDLIYYMLCLVMGVALAYAAIVGLHASRRSSAGSGRRQARGIALAAIGVAVALAGGLLADALLKRTSYFQQVRFALYYLGFALIILGITRVMDSTHIPKLSRSAIPDLILWVCFSGPLLLAVVYLAVPRTFILNSAGLQVQRTLYWIPMLAATGVAALLLVWAALRRGHDRATAVLWWTAAFAALICFGLLRESLILPDLGDPLRNLLVAFIPFVLGSFCLSLGVRRTHFLSSPFSRAAREKGWG